MDEAAIAFASRMRFALPEGREPPADGWIVERSVFWPLIVIDDVPRPDLRHLDDLRDIEGIRHVEVLKRREGPAERYGEWAAAGVIRITTDEGAR